MRLEGFEISKRSVVLLTLAAISIIIIGDGKKKNNKNPEDFERDQVIDDINVKVLQELNQTVSPNSSTGQSPILKKVVSIIKSFYESFWTKIFKGNLKSTLVGIKSKIKSTWDSVKSAFNQAAGGLIDMLAYTSMLIPIMNVLDTVSVSIALSMTLRTFATCSGFNTFIFCFFKYCPLRCNLTYNHIFRFFIKVAI